MSGPPEMPCQELVGVISDYVDGAMPAADRVRFEAHIAECEPCREYLAQFDAVIAAAGYLTVEDVPAEAREALSDAFRSWAEKR